MHRDPSPIQPPVVHNNVTGHLAAGSSSIQHLMALNGNAIRTGNKIMLLWCLSSAYRPPKPVRPNLPSCSSPNSFRCRWGGQIPEIISQFIKTPEVRLQVNHYVTEPKTVPAWLTAGKCTVPSAVHSIYSRYAREHCREGITVCRWLLNYVMGRHKQGLKLRGSRWYLLTI